MKTGSTSYDKLIQLVEKGCRVLDVGCSYGCLGERLIREKGCSMWGIEIDPVKAEKAKEFYRDIFIGSVEDEEFLNSIKIQFDVVILADVIEHLRKPEYILKSVSGWLSDRGYLLLSVPNIGHWSVAKDLIFGRFEYAEAGLLDKTHIHFYVRKSLEGLLHDCELEITLRDCTLGIFANDINKISIRMKIRIGLIKFLYLILPHLFAYQFIYKVIPKAQK